MAWRALIMLFCFPPSIALANECAPTQYTYEVDVVSVYDADTITVDIDLGFNFWWRDQSLRIYGINAPEMRGSEKAQGTIARDTLRGWLKDADRVWINSIKDKSGKFGRPLAVVCIEGWPRSVNHRLWKEGYAKFAPYSSSKKTIEAIEAIVK